MAATQEEGQRSYQRALRVIGRYLDSERAHNASVAEVQNGFTVRSYPVSPRSDEVTKHFEWDRLGDLDLFYSGGRGVEKGPSRQPDRQIFPCGQEAAWRKLGSILDEQGAASLRIDETATGLDVSYTRSGGGGNPEEAHKVFTATELC